MTQDGFVLDQLAETAKALAHPHRLAILNLLSAAERPVEEIATATGLSMANASQHLQILRRADLVRSRRDGKRVFYGLSQRKTVDVLDSLRRLGLASLGDDAVTQVGADELRQLLLTDAIVLLDVRDASQYAEEHIPGAINIGLLELEAQIDALPKTQKIVAYCNGPLCILSIEAARQLQKTGRDVVVMPGGLAEWRAAEQAAPAR